MATVTGDGVAPETQAFGDSVNRFGKTEGLEASRTSSYRPWCPSD